MEVQVSGALNSGWSVSYTYISCVSESSTARCVKQGSGPPAEEKFEKSSVTVLEGMWNAYMSDRYFSSRWPPKIKSVCDLGSRTMECPAMLVVSMIIVNGK